MHAVNASTGAAVWTSAAVIGSILSSPRVSNGLVYYGATDKKIYAINENNGSLKWNYSTGDIITSSPMVYGGMCIIGSTDYGLYCIDTTSPSTPPSGELRWKYMTNERINYSSATIHEASNTLLIGGYDFNLYAIDHVSGTLKWKYPAGSLIKSSPVVYGNYVYFVAVDRYLYCVDVRNGSAVWKSYLNGSTESSPMVDDLQNGQYPSVSGMSKY
jgi:outer membrane protein assembly factor BamB